MPLLHDPRLRSIRWKDLTRLTTRQRIIENSITIPWLLISCGLAFFHYYLLALPFSFVFFLTGLRQVHNGFHYTLGVSRTLTEATLFVNSLLMMTAMPGLYLPPARIRAALPKSGHQKGRPARAYSDRPVRRPRLLAPYPFSRIPYHRHVHRRAVHRLLCSMDGPPRL